MMHSCTHISNIIVCILLVVSSVFYDVCVGGDVESHSIESLRERERERIVKHTDTKEEEEEKKNERNSNQCNIGSFGKWICVLRRITALQGRFDRYA